MKKIISMIILLVPVFILVFCSGSVSVDHNKKKIEAVANNIIVLELFTSQGCSSCPPADRLLGKYANREDIAALSFHVDYWNKLGWTDPFSDHQFSQRQEIYSSTFAAEGIYTPQLIINGEKEMIGSDEDKIAATIKQFQKQKSSSQIIIDELKMGNNKLSITYSVKGKFNNSVVNIALVQNKITTSIKAGENNGVTLTNYNVVKNFKTVNSFKAEKNTATIDMIAEVNKKDLGIIIFLQDTSSNKIYAAAKSAL